MAEIPRIYIESCPIIDMAKHEARIALSEDPTIQAQRENNVWFCDKILDAARNGDLKVFTSSISIVECTQVEAGVPVPSQDVMDFYNMLLSSGRSGIVLVQMTQTIQVEARNLKWQQGVNLKPYDSIHIASALHMGCSEFITIDNRIYQSREHFSHANMAIIQASETQLLPATYRQDDLNFVEGQDEATEQEEENP